MREIPKRILIIDDSLIIRDEMRKILTEGGYDVVGEAKNYDEALKHFQEDHPDLVTLDIIMGDPDGLAILKKIHELSPQCLVVMVSGLQQTNLVKQAIDLGAKDYILKPFKKERVLNVLRNIFLRQGHSDEL